MTETKDIDELILRARKMLHDMNQPLTVIMARTELMTLKMAADDPQRRSVEQMHQQAENLSQLIEDMRSLFQSYREE